MSYRRFLQLLQHSRRVRRRMRAMRARRREIQRIRNIRLQMYQRFSPGMVPTLIPPSQAFCLLTVFQHYAHNMHRLRVHRVSDWSELDRIVVDNRRVDPVVIECSAHLPEESITRIT